MLKRWYLPQYAMRWRATCNKTTCLLLVPWGMMNGFYHEAHEVHEAKAIMFKSLSVSLHRNARKEWFAGAWYPSGQAFSLFVPFVCFG
jgi:hypothetical protein